MTKNRKVLFIHHGSGLGGAPKSMARVANKMKTLGMDVKVLFLKNSEAINLLEDIDFEVIGLPTLYFNHSSRWYKWYEVHLVLYQIFSWIVTVFFIAPYWLIKIKPDTVYLNSSVLTDWMVASKFFGIKSVVHVRESIAKGYFGIRNNIIRLLISKFSDEVIFLSKHNRQRIGKLESNVNIVHNYVFETVPVNDLGQRSYDIIYVGGSREIKGINLITQLLRKNCAYEICLLGYYDEKFCEEFQAYPNVHIIGAVKNSMQYINDSKFLLFPATTPHFPRPVIEAMSCGTIPIMSNLEGADEIITNNVDGVLFESDNLPELMQNLEMLEGQDLTQMSKKGFSCYKEKFSVQNEIKILEIIMQA